MRGGFELRTPCAEANGYLHYTTPTANEVQFGIVHIDPPSCTYWPAKLHLLSKSYCRHLWIDSTWSQYNIHVLSYSLAVLLLAEMMSSSEDVLADERLQRGTRCENMTLLALCWVLQRVCWTGRIRDWIFFSKSKFFPKTKKFLNRSIRKNNMFLGNRFLYTNLDTFQP